jgi:hypothetical protein
MLSSVPGGFSPARVSAEEQVKLIPVGANIARLVLHFGFMDHLNIMKGLELACRGPRSAWYRSREDHLVFATGHGRR